jgi:hypothetical protein
MIHHKDPILLFAVDGLLLPKHYREDPIDTGNVIGASYEEVLDDVSVQRNAELSATNLSEANLSQQNTPENLPRTPLESALNTENTLLENTSINAEQILQSTTQLFEKLLKKLENLEQRVQGIQNDKTPHSSNDTVIKTVIEPIIETVTVINTNAPRLTQYFVENTKIEFSQKEVNPSSIDHNNHSQNQIKNTVLMDNRANIECNDQGVIPPENSTIENTEDDEDWSNIAQISAQKSLNTDDLYYPEALNSATRQALTGLLNKAADNAQNILDLLGLRLKNTQKPINDIVLYCASLVRKAQNDNLDLDGLQAYHAQQKARFNPQEKQRQALQMEYREAYNEYQHFKRINQGQAKNYNCTVEEYLQQSGMIANWEAIVQRLENVKQAIES